MNGLCVCVCYIYSTGGHSFLFPIIAYAAPYIHMLDLSEKMSDYNFCISWTLPLYLLFSPLKFAHFSLFALPNKGSTSYS